MQPMSRTGTMRVAVVGATGVVGTTITSVLAERRFRIDDYVPIATSKTSGRSVRFLDRDWLVREAADVDFDGIDVCFFTAGAKVSLSLIPKALEAGCRVVDNTTAYRMDPEVPLVVPEINGALVSEETTLISCPNCTTINLVMALAPILREVEIKRVVVTSLQSVSGAGREAIEELDTQSRAQLDGEPPTSSVFPTTIAFNCIPVVGNIEESGYTGEEQKIIEETKKILDAPDLGVVPTAVRVPVHVGHALSVNMETAEQLRLDKIKKLWRNAPGVIFDDGLPTPRDIAGRDEVFVARLRNDPTRPTAVNFWVVGDNLRKGAATNSVQIAELWQAV